jgi:hypothetical protein
MKERRSTGRVELLTEFFIVAPLVAFSVMTGLSWGGDPRVTIADGDDCSCQAIVKLMSSYLREGWQIYIALKLIAS